MQQSEIIISEQCNIMFIFWTGKYAKTKCNSLHLVYLRPAPHFWSGFLCQALTRQAEIAATLIAVWAYGDEGRRTPDGLCTDVEACVFIDGFSAGGGGAERVAQRLLAASDVYSPSKSNSSVYRLHSCVHSSRVGVFDSTVWPKSF